MDKTVSELTEIVETLVRSHQNKWEEHKDVQDWSEGVFRALKVTQDDVTVVKKDVKELTAATAAMNTAVELLKSDHLHSAERWKELKEILFNLQENGCDVYARHRALDAEKTKAEAVEEHEAAQAAAQAAAQTKEKAPKTGRTVWDIISSWTPTNIALASIIALMVLILMYHDKILKILQAL